MPANLVGPRTDGELEDQVNGVIIQERRKGVDSDSVFGSSGTQGRKHAIVDYVYSFMSPIRVGLVDGTNL